MRTIQILLQLVNSIATNPSILPLLPWEDIRLCLFTELENRDSLYTEEQILQRNAVFTELLEEMRQFGAAGDTNAVISRFCWNRPISIMPACAITGKIPLWCWAIPM